MSFLKNRQLNETGESCRCPQRENRESGVKPERSRHCYREPPRIKSHWFCRPGRPRQVMTGSQETCLPVNAPRCRGDPLDDGKVHGLF